MKDRIPKHPGRVKLTPVSGQTNTYDLVRADEPIEEGSALNKANLLPDDVAEEIGLNAASNPQVKDALLSLNNNKKSIETEIKLLGETSGTTTLSIDVNEYSYFILAIKISSEQAGLLCPIQIPAFIYKNLPNLSLEKIFVTYQNYVRATLIYVSESSLKLVATGETAILYGVK